MRFWDSSALIPLVIGQPTSARCDSWLDEDAGVAIWTLTPVELSSVIQRLAREGTLDERAAVAAERNATDIVRSCHVVIDVEHVKTQARRLLRLHALRAADALQLAAALEWSGGRPAGRIVHTFDARLGAAANREGFDVPGD